MPSITALIQTRNDGRRIGRALETLLPCAEIVIVDHGSEDSTLRVARAYGARVVRVEGSGAGDLTSVDLGVASCDWIFCLRATESLTEGLQATLYEWSFRSAEQVQADRGYSVAVRGQEGGLWEEEGVVETRLVPRDWRRWDGWLPGYEREAQVLEGEILRLAFP